NAPATEPRSGGASLGGWTSTSLNVVAFAGPVVTAASASSAARLRTKNALDIDILLDEWLVTRIQQWLLAAMDPGRPRSHGARVELEHERHLGHREQVVVVEMAVCRQRAEDREVQIERAVGGQSDRPGLARRGVERRHRGLVLAVAHRQIEVLPHR